MFCKVYTDGDTSICERNIIIYKLFELYDIPCPKIVFYDLTGEKCGYPSIMLSEIKGEKLNDILRSNNSVDINAIYHEFGEITAKIHSILFDQFGEIHEENGLFYVGPLKKIEKGPFNTWVELMNPIQTQRMKILKDTKHEYLITPLKKFTEQQLKNYKQINPRLCHGDLNSHNIIIHNGNISGIIDVDEAFSGNYEEDLMRIELDHFQTNFHLKQIFFKSYQEHIYLNEDYYERRRLFYVSRNLIRVNLLINLGKKISNDPEVELFNLCSHLLEVINGGKF